MQITQLVRVARQHAHGLGREVGQFVIALDCAGCGRFGSNLCHPCWLEWQIGAMRVEAHAPALAGSALPVWAAAVYDGAVRQAVVGIKERGRADVLNLISGAALRVAERLAPALNGARGPGEPLVIVPVPARTPAWASQRPVQLPEYFGVELAGQLRSKGVAATLAAFLRHTRFTRDQVGLGRIARLQNRGGSMRLKRATTPGSHPILLVDDVVTTGATLREAARELVQNGAKVLGGAVIAATPRRQPIPEVSKKI